jgi:hypothetical protein
MAIEILSPTPVEIPPSITQRGNVFFEAGAYAGTEDDVQRLNDFTKTPGFAEKYPHHVIFADGDAVIGSIDTTLEEESPQRNEELQRLDTALKERNLGYLDCAVIRSDMVAKVDTLGQAEVL